MILSRLVLACLVALAFAAAACSDQPVATAPSTPELDIDEDNDDDDDDEPHFVRAAEESPPLARTSLTFYAVRGKTRVARIMYRALPGRNDSTEFLRFTVPHDASLARPDGSPVASGDSIPITIAVVDQEHLIVEFQPSGLGFGTAHPARLRMSFVYTDDDLDEDGDVDDDDEQLRRTLAIWKSESPDGDWQVLPSNTRFGIETTETLVSGFTRYAIAH